MASRAPSESDSTSPRRIHWALKLLIALLIVLLLLVAAAPTLMSSTPGRNLALGMINDRVPGTLSIESWSLGWFGSQRASGIRLDDPEGVQVLTLETFRTELGLLQALRGRLGIGETLLRGLRAELVVDETGRDNLRAALGLEPTEAEPGDQILIPITGHVVLEDGYLSWTAPGVEPAVLEALQADVRLDPDTRDLALSVSGRSRQGDMTGNIRMQGEIRDWLDRRGALTPARMDPDLDAEIERLPVYLLDGLAGFEGLLVAALGDRLDARLASADREIDVTLQTPRLSVDLGARLRELELGLTRAGSVLWTLTPEFVAGLGTEAEDPLRLERAVDLRLAIEHLQAPLVDFDPARVALRGRFDTSAPVHLAGAGLDAVRLEDVAAEVFSDVLAEAVRLSAGAAIHSDGRPGTLALEANVSELFDAAGRLQTDRMRVNANANLSDLPVGLLDGLAGGTGLLGAVMGPHLGLDARAATGDDGRIDVSFEMRSEHLQVDPIRLQVDDTIRLLAPARIRYRVAPAVVEHFAPPESETRLDAPADVEIVLAEFSAPRPAAGEPAFQPERTRLGMRLSATALELRGADDVRTRLSDLRAELGGDSLAAMALRARSSVAQNASGVLALMQASPVNMRLDVDSGLAAEGGLAETRGHLELIGGALEARLPFAVSAGMESLTLTEPGRLRLPLTPALLASHLQAEDDREPIRLADAALLKVDLDRLQMNLTEPGLRGIEAEGRAELDQLRFLAGNEPLAGIEGLAAGLTLEGARGRGRIDLDGRVSSGGEAPGTIRGQVDLTDIGVDDGGTAVVDLELARLPAALAGVVLDQPAMPKVLGSALDMKVASRIRLGETPRGSATLETSARNLRLDADLELADTIRLRRPAQLRFTLTPEAHAALRPPAETPDSGGLLVAAETVVDAAVTRLNLRRGEEARGRLPELEAHLNVAESRLQHSRTGEEFLLRRLAAEVETDAEGRSLRAKVTSQVTEGDAPPGNLDFDLRLGNLFDAEDNFSIDAISLDLDGDIQQLPVLVLDRFMDFDGLVLATLGRTLNMRVDGRVRDGAGPLSLEMRADNARADIRAQWSEGTMTLRETLSAEVQATEEFGRAVLARAHPIFETMRGGDQPIRLVMPAEGVLVPVRDFAIENVRVPEMRLELGQIELERGWLLNGLMTLGERFGNLRPMGDRFTAEFTPAVMSVQEGRLRYARRMDVLLGDQMHFASWGGMDLVNRRADLILGIMPLTLRSVFGVAAGEGDALRIPLSGAPGEGMIDISRIGIELGRMQAQQRLGEASPLFGVLLGATAGATPGLTDAPEPSVSPLPWAERLAEKARQAEEAARQRQQEEQTQE